jgi:predicted nucleic acid-binding protein
MTRPRVYVETTIPSVYHETRPAPAIVARRDWTRRWWATAPTRYELVTSEAVLEELSAGPTDRSPDWLALLAGLPVLPATPSVTDIADTYIARKLAPANPRGDALHLALASFHRCDYLVTWNCQHLANANKFPHLRRVSDQLGLWVPTLVTPLELLGEAHDDPA